MKNSVIFLSFICFVFFSYSAFAQNGNKATSGITKIAWAKTSPKFITFKPKASIAAKAVFTVYHNEFGLGNSDEMRLLRTDVDKQGVSHHRYQQYNNGIPVEGAVFILHEKEGKVQTGNGTIIKGLNLPAAASVSPELALQKAISEVPSEMYIWQDTESEKMLKELKNDPSASYYPEPELLIFDKKFGSDASGYTLAYKVEIYSIKPLDRKFVYIDAISGNVLHSINMIQHTDVPATGLTKYNGAQPVTVDSVSPGSYRLRETGRGNGVITRSAQNGENYILAVDVYDNNDTLFDTDDIAMAAHWATEKTYDYYFNTFGRNSFDNNGAALLSYVHYSSNYANAFWDGTRMTYGDGNSQYSAFTAIDICGHEITHAVTTYTADLIYQDESGALNEAFSDIFGTCVEFYADTTPNWEMGEDIGVTLRSMSDPNLYDCPDTYHGTKWDYDAFNMDNGGVHTNCGVGSFWFYLLCEGGNGTNDNGEPYSVSALGQSTAEMIAYNTLAYFLTPSSVYIDAYHASLAAAESLYGTCSNEVYQTANAWAAVGVGFPFDPQEVYILDVISPSTACDLHSEIVSVRLFYNGCDTLLQANDTVSIAYQFDNGTIFSEEYILAGDWQGGDSLNVDFTLPVDASTIGSHTLNCWVKYGAGNINYTDSIMNYTFSTLLQQNIDLGMKKISAPASDCHFSSSEHVTIEFSFFGCDFMPAGTTTDLKYRVNNGNIITEQYTLTNDFYPSQTITYTFTETFDGTADGNYIIDAWTAFIEDTLTSNDAFLGYTIKNVGALDTDTLGFEESNALDFVLIQTTPHSNVNIKPGAHAPGSTKGLLMTGGNALMYVDMLEIPSGFNTWQINEFLSAKASFCVDATSWNTTYLKFDLKQTHGGPYYAQYIGGNSEDYRVASNLRLLANNNQIGTTYNPTNPSSDPFVTYLVNLNTYSGSDFILTFETRNICKDTTYLFPMILDNAYLDNIHFFPGPFAGDDTTSVRNINSVDIPMLENDLNNGVAALTTKITVDASNGTATLVSNSLISYTPDAGFLGYDTIVYQICYSTDTTICDEAYISIRVHDGLSVQEIPGTVLLSVYPNPFNSTFTIEAESKEQTIVNITITDVIGKKITTEEKMFMPGNNRINFDLSDEPCGIYFVQVKTQNMSNVIKVTRK